MNLKKIIKLWFNLPIKKPYNVGARQGIAYFLHTETSIEDDWRKKDIEENFRVKGHLKQQLESHFNLEIDLKKQFIIYCSANLYDTSIAA